MDVIHNEGSAKLSLCLLCEELITEETDSREHIIPNSIGGRKKVKGFICIECNSRSGDSWEAALARELNPLSLYFRIKRERGSAPEQDFNTADGEGVKLYADGALRITKPIYNLVEEDGVLKVDLIARDMKNANQMLKGIGKKYPQFDLNKLLKQAQEKSTYLSEPINFNLNLKSIDSGRSFVKTVLALASSRGVDVSCCEHAINFLREGHNSCFGYYYDEKDMVIDRPKNVPIHVVHVNGDPGNSLVLGYLEYFGMIRVVMYLSSNYSGGAFSETYCIDPTTGQELDLFVDLYLTDDEIQEVLLGRKKDPDIKAQIIKSVMDATFEKHNIEEKERVINDALQYAFANCGAVEGEMLTDVQCDIFWSLFEEKLDPWLMSQIRRS